MIIGITGTNGAGKGTVVKYLVQKGFTHYSVRGELEDELGRRGLPKDRPHLGRTGNELREKNGPEYFINLFISRAAEKGIFNIAIESIRSLGEVEALKARQGILLAVDADQSVRYGRVGVRGSGTDNVDFDTWVKQEEYEWHNTAAHDMNVPGVIARADYTLQNNGTLEELHQQIDAVLATLK